MLFSTRAAFGLAVVLASWCIVLHQRLLARSVARRGGAEVSRGSPHREPADAAITRLARNRMSAEAAGANEHYEDETIFVAIASYGDPECGATLERIFARAAAPDRISVAICQQHNCSAQAGAAERAGATCMDCVAAVENLCAKQPTHPVCSRLATQVRVHRMPMRETRGVTYARHLAEAMYANETYAMNIDAHSRFVRGWDSLLIDMWKRVGDEYAILTAYPSPYPVDRAGMAGADDDYEVKAKVIMSICRTRKVRVDVATYAFKHEGCPMALPKAAVHTAFLAAGLNFARGHRVRAVPYDPYTPFLFDNEEMSLGVRLWTHGYNMYIPPRMVVGHLYLQGRGKGARPVFWTERWAERHKQQVASVHRVNYMMGVHAYFNEPVARRVEAIDTRDLSKYTLGTARSVATYYDWAGIAGMLRVGGDDVSHSLLARFKEGGLPPVPRRRVDADAAPRAAEP